jgi:hypothetical protein
LVKSRVSAAGSIAECGHSAPGALVGFHDVAAHHDDRHAVAPGVVHRHAGVLQADHAMADHGERLARHLGVALSHVDRDLLMRTGDDLGLGVAAVVDQRLMQAAEARGAVHREVVDVERLEHVDHEVAAARGLVDRIGRRRHRIRRGKLGPRHLGLGARRRFGSRRDGGIGGRRQRGCTNEAGAFQETASLVVRCAVSPNAVCLGHEFLPTMCGSSYRAVRSGVSAPPLRGVNKRTRERATLNPLPCRLRRGSTIL